jgi:chitosanase
MRPDAETIHFIRRILFVAETGTAHWDPGTFYIYPDDNRFSPPRKQITVSLGFTESGNLAKLFETYLGKGGEKTELGPYLKDLGKKSRPSLAKDKAFLALIEEAGKDPKMKEAQRECFNEFYLEPALEWGAKHGFKEPLSYLVIADSFLHSGSMLNFLIARFPEKKPIEGGEERKWIKAYLETRHRWLRNHSNKILHKTVYRAEAYLREIERNNWDLLGDSVLMHGTEVSREA